jgi:hypothetical protein
MALVVYNPEQNTPPGLLKGAGDWTKDYWTALRNGRLKPFSATERKVRRATRDEACAPTGQELQELARLSASFHDRAVILAIVEMRMSRPPKKWRNVLKALAVLEFLVLRGDEECVTRARGDMKWRLESLAGFSYFTSDGRDVGSNISAKARALAALLADDAKLRAEREATMRRGGGHATGNGGNGEGQWAPPSSPKATKNEDTQVKEPSSFAVTPDPAEVPPADQGARCAAGLKRLLARADNRLCADCAVSGIAYRPTWASPSLGVFVCLRCAGIHRGLGSHISKVSSNSVLSFFLRLPSFGYIRNGPNVCAIFCLGCRGPSALLCAIIMHSLLSCKVCCMHALLPPLSSLPATRCDPAC